MTGLPDTNSGGEERPCEKCKDVYPLEGMPWGMCPDCWDNLQSKDLEDRIEELL